MGVTVARVYAGDGYTYLVRSVAMGDEARKGTRLSDYYSLRGEQPGRWLGTGTRNLNAGAGVRGAVTAEQMERLIGRGVDPVTGRALGRAFTIAAKPGKRAQLAVAARNRAGEHLDAGDVLSLAFKEEPRGVQRPSVAAFDLTCEAPKSVSVLWALADDTVREQVELAQADAVNAVVHFLETDVAKSRVGAGGVGQVDVVGVAAVAFTHHESRSVDPHVHTHLVVSNKVLAADGKWRTVDSQALYHATVTASETYNTALQDALTARLGVAWRDREVTRGRKTVRELAGVPDVLVDAFSSRRRQIAPRLAALERDFAVRTGRAPGRAEREQLSRQAWREQRPVKEHDRPSLREFFTAWTATAESTLAAAGQSRGADGTRVAAALQQVLPYDGTGARTAAATTVVTDADVHRVAAAVIDMVSETRSTWTMRHLQAEALRQTATIRCATQADRAALVDRVVATAVTPGPSQDDPVLAAGGLGVVLLAAPSRVPEPGLLRRADGVSVFVRHRADRYTTRTVLDAEAAILAAATAPAVPTLAVDPRLVTAVLDRVGTVTGRPLGADQAAAVRQVATDGRTVSCVIGPAGTGKSTTMTALTAVWTAGHGPGRVVAAAPSAAAAQVLTDSLSGAGTAVDGVHAGAVPGAGGTRTAGPVTARTMHALLADLRPHDSPTDRAGDGGRAARLVLRPGDLVLLDEVGMAPTLLLAELTAHVRTAGAKLLLVGDDAQLGAVAAGGALRMLAASAAPDPTSTTAGERTSVATLDGVWRFTEAWERDATLRLRTGQVSVIAEYARRGRLVEGDADVMLEAAYTAWQADERNGRVSLLIAADNSTVEELNARARADLVAAGTVAPTGVTVSRPGGEDLTVGVGDRVVTRRNTRTVQVLKGTDVVRNGDLWNVEATRADGSVAVRHTGHGGRAVLPTDYVQQHVDLGYATTAYRAQGATVDTAHLVLTPTLVRETAYVGMTRGRHANTAYVITGDPVTGPETHQSSWAAGDPPTGADIWKQVLATEGAERAAHTVITDELTASVSLATLVPRYDFAAQTWHTLGWPTLVSDALTARRLTPDRYPPPTTEPTQASPVPARACAPAWSVSPAMVPFAATLSSAARAGLDPVQLFRKAVLAGNLTPADGVRDPVAALQARVEAAVAATGTAGEDPGQQALRRTHPWVAGLTPAMPTGNVGDPELTDLAAYLAALADAIERRADALALTAVSTDPPWLPATPRELSAMSPLERVTLLTTQDRAGLGRPTVLWWDAVRHTAAYRDLTGTTDPTRPLGEPAEPGTAAETVRNRVQASLHAATAATAATLSREGTSALPSPLDQRGAPPPDGDTTPTWAALPAPTWEPARADPSEINL